ncbi:MAG: radical SAM protein, partial [Bacteroidales bacterium]|nr:radical SAM protein [Bacteroidales bacterium]
MDYYFKIADTCSIHKIAGYDQSYIVDNTNGCWCVFDNEFSDFISAFIGNSVSSVDLHLNHTHFALLKSLFMQGILRINEESYFTEKETKETNNRLTIIVNTTNRCNLRCDYCYAYSDSPHRLSFSPVSIEEDIKKIAGNNTKQEILVVFHGGEPLLCWDRIVEMVQKLSDTFDDISFSIQTNGTLINKQIVDFVKTHNIRIGVSLDGSDKQTNIHRFGEDNNDYLNTVSRNIDLLTHNGVKFGILSVVTNENYKELLNSMSFFVEKGVRGFGYNYILSKGRSSDKNPAVPVSELVDVYTKIACYINDYNARHDPKDYISERTVSVLVYSLAHKPLGACYSSPCMAGDGHFALDVNGDV